MSEIVYLNGEFMPLENARIPVLDRGFIFGDGVYEVIPVYSRHPFRLPEHLARFERSHEAIRIANPMSDAEWTRLVQDLVARNAGDDQSIYLQVTRGVAKRDHAFPKDAKPTVFGMSSPLSRPAREAIESGVPAITAIDYRWLKCDVKSTSLLGNCLLRQAAADAGAVEVVMFRDGFLTEGSSSNVFVVKNGTILAPPKNNLVLPGHHLRRRARARAGERHEVRGAADLGSRSAERRRNLGDVVDEGSARGDDARRQTGRHRQAGRGVPAHAPALSGFQADGDASGRVAVMATGEQ